jgi:hypothetical protein
LSASSPPVLVSSFAPAYCSIPAELASVGHPNTCLLHIHGPTFFYTTHFVNTLASAKMPHHPPPPTYRCHLAHIGSRYRPTSSSRQQVERRDVGVLLLFRSVSVSRPCFYSRLTHPHRDWYRPASVPLLHIHQHLLTRRSHPTLYILNIFFGGLLPLVSSTSSSPRSCSVHTAI